MNSIEFLSIHIIDVDLFCKSTLFSHHDSLLPATGLLALQDADESQLREPERGYALPGVSFTAEARGARGASFGPSRLRGRASAIFWEPCPHHLKGTA